MSFHSYFDITRGYRVLPSPAVTSAEVVVAVPWQAWACWPLANLWPVRGSTRPWWPVSDETLGNRGWEHLGCMGSVAWCGFVHAGVWFIDSWCLANLGKGRVSRGRMQVSVLRAGDSPMPTDFQIKGYSFPTYSHTFPLHVWPQKKSSRSSISWGNNPQPIWAHGAESYELQRFWRRRWWWNSSASAKALKTLERPLLRIQVAEGVVNNKECLTINIMLSSRMLQAKISTCEPVCHFIPVSNSTSQIFIIPINCMIPGATSCGWPPLLQGPFH